MFVAKLIKEGKIRSVFTMENPDLIMKVTKTGFSNKHNMHNIQEWEIWHNSPKHLKRWLVQPIALLYGVLFL